MTTIELNEPLLEVSHTKTDAGFIRRLFSRWHRRRRERVTLEELSRMPPHLLRDIGIQPGDLYDALNGDRRSALFKRIDRPDHGRP
jgi:uncharacterized protein YjiS (DUF1127 family)